MVAAGFAAMAGTDIRQRRATSKASLFPCLVLINKYSFIIMPGAVRRHVLQVLSGNDVLLVHKLVVRGLHVIKRNECSISVGAPCAVTVDGDHSVATALRDIDIIPQRGGIPVPAHQQIANVDLVSLRREKFVQWSPPRW